VTAAAPEENWVGPSDLPNDAATRAAMEEIRRFEQPDVYEGPPGIVEGTPGELYGRATARGTGYVVPTSAAGTQHQVPKAREFRGLEDLYAAYPAIADGTRSTYLRVERTSPKFVDGFPCAGLVEPELHERIPTSEFAARFGGSAYEVSVVGPIEGMVDSYGQPRLRTLATIKLNVLGAPKISKPMMHTPGQSATDPRIEIRRMELDAQARERREASNGQATPQMVEALREATTSAVGQVREASRTTEQMLREVVTMQMAELDKLRTNVERLRNELLEANRREAHAVNEAKTTASRDATDLIEREGRVLRERHEAETTRLRDEHQRNSEKLEREHRDQLSQSSSRYNEERTATAILENRERERMREDAVRREASLTADSTRQLSSQKESYESRIADLQRQLDREVATLRDVQTRELASVRSTEETKTALTKETTAMQLSVAHDRLKRVESELLQMRRENEELRAKQNKDPLTFIRETKEMAKSLGMIEESNAPAAGDDGKFSFGKAAELIGNLIEKGPAMLQPIFDARKQNQQVAAQAAQQAAMAAQGGYAGYPPQMMAGPPMPPPMVRQRRQAPRNVLLAPPPAWAPEQQAPQGGFGAPPAAPVAFSPTPSPASGVHVPSGAALVQMDAPPPPPPPAPVPPPDPMQQPQAAPPVQAAQARVTQDAVTLFISELEGAVRSGQIPPGLFARGVIAEVGVDVARDLVTKVTPQDVFTALEAQQAPSAILTRDGQAYVVAVWEEARKMVG